ncbi:DUF3710 domain-containing protein [Planomonospora alba]|uniref:DUF3710 domain-containing protein n=1 Tax=Planomonospora alba TaxID=161354 RepID=A0ABP6MWH0_9ACTN
MFGRRRHRQEETPAVAEETARAPERESGPWDAEEPHPERERVDLGGLRLPVGPGFEIQLNLAGDRIVGAIALVDGSALQVQAFAAPKRSGIWDEVRAELVTAVRKAGGTAEEAQGPFGTELLAKVPGEEGPQQVRYLGVDGPRWFLRAVISGRAAQEAAAAAVLEDVVRDIVVVRGDEPMPPHEPIELRLPPEARQAADRQAAGTAPDLNPFRRGPEIAEIR